MDGNGGHEDGQRDAGDQVIHGHLRVGDHLAGLTGEVADVEGADRVCAGADFLDIDAEVWKDVVDQSARVAHGFHALRGSVFRERHQGDELVHVERFPSGYHLVGREAGEQHGEIDGAAGRAVDVIEFDARFGQRLDDAGLVSDAHAAAGEDERTPGSGHDTVLWAAGRGAVLGVAASFMYVKIRMPERRSKQATSMAAGANAWFMTPMPTATNAPTFCRPAHR